MNKNNPLTQPTKTKLVGMIHALIVPQNVFESNRRDNVLQTRQKPILSQIQGLIKDIENCIDSIDEGQPESARSDLCLILQELKGEEE